MDLNYDTVSPTHDDTGKNWGNEQGRIPTFSASVGKLLFLRCDNSHTDPKRII